MLFTSQGVALRLMSVLLLPYICLTQNISIVSPFKGQVIHPGQNLTVVIKPESTTSSLERVTFSVGFNAKPKVDPTSLGRPYLGSIVPGVNGTVQNPANGTFSFNITVPPASAFLDGFSSDYNLNVATYYTLGATYTPKVQLASVQVTIQNTTWNDNSHGNTSGGNSTSSNTNTGSNTGGSGNSGESDTNTNPGSQTGGSKNGGESNTNTNPGSQTGGSKNGGESNTNTNTGSQTGGSKNSGGSNSNTNTGSHTGGSTTSGGSNTESNGNSGSNSGTGNNSGSTTPNGQPKAFGNVWKGVSTVFASYVFITLFRSYL